MTQEEIDYYMNNPLQLMLQQKFLKSFGNIAYYNNPVLSGEEANQFAQQMEGKVSLMARMLSLPGIALLNLQIRTIKYYIDVMIRSKTGSDKRLKSKSRAQANKQ